MSGPTTDDQIEAFRTLAASLWARQAHAALGVTWERFLADLGVLTPQDILPAAERPAERDPGQLPGFGPS